VVVFTHFACVVSETHNFVDVGTNNFDFVSAELHPCLCTQSLSCVYHHLEFASIGQDKTQNINVKNSSYPPDLPTMGDGSIGELQFQFVNQVSHKKSRV